MQCLMVLVAAAAVASQQHCVNSDAKGFCASINDTALVGGWRGVVGKPWAARETLSIFGVRNGSSNCLFSALDVAKVWIVATDGMTAQPSDGRTTHMQGGCASCQAAVAVALQEGGNQVPPSAVLPAAVVPQTHTDPTFSTVGLCPDGERCTSGSFWQVSNAWVRGGTCVVCEDPEVRCSSLKNPFCAARVAFRWAQYEDTNRPCLCACGNVVALPLYAHIYLSVARV